MCQWHQQQSALICLMVLCWVLCVAERGKGRQRQAILGEHPSSYNDNGYGQCLFSYFLCPPAPSHPILPTSSSFCCCRFFSIFLPCPLSFSHLCPLLSLPLSISPYFSTLFSHSVSVSLTVLLGRLPLSPFLSHTRIISPPPTPRTMHAVLQLGGGVAL